MHSAPSYTKCNKKLEARLSTIIEPYRSIFNTKLPDDKQYWTLCAKHSHNGLLLQNSELDQITKEGLISKEQFHGVDIEKGIIESNQAAIPEANWSLGDFNYVIRTKIQTGNFNPGIVNFDHIQMPKTAIPKMAELLCILSDYNDVMFIGNLVLKHRWGEVTQEEIIQEFNKSNRKDYIFSRWSFNHKIYTYNGTGQKSKTTMGSFVMYRNNHDQPTLRR